MSKIVVLTEGSTNPNDAKTAAGIVRYRGSEVVAILDSSCAGRTAQDVLGAGGSIPCVASLHDVEADTLLIGIAPAGGYLPRSWRDVICEAIRKGLDVVSGLHYFLEDDEEFRALAAKNGVRIHDVRRPPSGLTVSSHAAPETPCFRVHTVGHDCGVGKLVVALELTRALKERGRCAAFIATGQTGIMISGSGVPIDAVVSDFVSGAIESEVIANRDAEFVLIEGQGSLVHPMYSGVTLGLLHGCAPQAMIMCIDPCRTAIRHCGVTMPVVEEVIDIYERMANIMAPSEVVGIALNTSELSRAEAEEEVRRAGERTGLPATDVIRFGVEPILDNLLRVEAESKRRPA